MTRLLLARHGQSRGNVERRLQDRDDPLTDAGRAQARRLAAALAVRGDLVALYASPLPRAWETARLVAEATGLSLVAVEELCEMDCGAAAGLTDDEFASRWPAASAAILAGGLDWGWPEGETVQQFRERVATAIGRLVTAHETEAGTVGIIAHGGVLSWAVAHLLGEAPVGWPGHRLDNCGVSILEPVAGRYALICRNDLAHLGDGSA